MPSKTLDGKIKLYISDKLQNQIQFLCEKIHRVEWSGVLFYTTEGGNFGDPDFKITAEEVVLMDIDTPVYTSYKFDGAFVKILMANSHLKRMQKGHLHSHCGMDVFFSGTDTTEILENSEFHNYYLSLIVNNRNQMTAKVAFRVQEIKQIIHKDISGISITTNLNNENQKSIYIYDCDVVKPTKVDAVTLSRFREIRDARKDKNDQLQKQQQTRNQVKYPIQTNENITKGERYIPIGQPQDLFSESDLNNKFVGTDVNENIRGFLIEFLGRGVKNQMLSQVLGNLNRRMKSNLDIDSFMNELRPELHLSYWKFFDYDHKLQFFEGTITTACKVLNDSYGMHYPNLIGQIIKKLKSFKNG